MTDPTGQPWNAVYNGFSTAAPRALSGSRPRSWPIPKAVTVGVGVGGALALGLLVGLFAKPDLGTAEPSAPMRAVTGPLPVVVSTPAPSAPMVAKPTGKLEVLSPEMARAAQRTLPVSAPMTAQTPLPVSQAAPQAPADDPACAGARGRAAQLVCADPDLAAADRELNQAYRRALRSGAPPDQLRADQRDWLAAREDAARRAPRRVADLYEQRIDELNQFAENGPG